MINYKKIGFFSDLKKEALQNPEVLKSFNEAQEMTRIHNLMIEARKKANITQTEVAKRLNTSRSYVSRLESNPENAHMKTIFRYLNACNVQLSISID